MLSLGVCEGKMKKDILGYAHPAKKTETKHIFPSVLNPCMQDLEKKKILMRGFILAIVVLAFCD